MQIQDNQRATKPQTDSRAGHRERFSPFGRIEAGNSDDLFAQIFQEIAATQTPSASAQPDDSLAPQESVEEVASDDKIDEPLAQVEESDQGEEREIDDPLVAGFLAASQVPVTNEAVAQQASEADDVENAAALTTVTEGEPVGVEQKPIGDQFEAALATEQRGAEAEADGVSESVEVASESAVLDQIAVSGVSSSETTVREGEANAKVQDSSQINELPSELTERLSSEETPRERTSEEESLTLPGPSAQATSDPTARDRRDRRGRGRESDARAGAVKASGQPNDVRAEVAAASGVSKPEIAQASDSQPNSSVSAELAASGLSATSPVAVAPPMIVPEAVAAASAIASAGASGNSGAAGNSGSADSSRATSAALGGVVASKSDAGEVVANHAKPAEGRVDVADRARLVHRIAKAFQRMGVDGGQVRLKMHPDDLGSVQLDMQISGRKVSATVTADNEEARLLLQSSLPELRQRLESQGLTVERLEVEKQNQEENRGFSNREQSNPQSGYEQSSGRRDDLWGRSTLARANSIAANRRGYGSETPVSSALSPLAASGGVPLDRSLDLQL